MTAAPIEIGLVGIGKIARDHHIPVLREDGAFRLVTGASAHASVDGLDVHASIEEMLAAHPTLQAVSLSNTPQARFATARAALKAGKHVMLEKPPGATLSEVKILERMAEQAGVTLFASWHSRFSSGAEPARAWLANRRVRRVKIDWREDVRHWHKGQAWIFEPGGLGVFDPGINALSLATAILPHPFRLKTATLDVPSNRAAPIAAELVFEDDAGASIEVGLDFLQTGPQTWDIRVETDDGELVLRDGGSRLTIPGQAETAPPDDGFGGVRTEYRGLYRRFAELIRSGRSEVDLSPMRHVADAFLRGKHVAAAPFDE
jgi:D-galactose 1-dehydrogenase